MGGCAVVALVNLHVHKEEHDSHLLSVDKSILFSH